MNYGVFLLTWMAVYLAGSLMTAFKGWKKLSDDDKGKVSRNWFMISLIIGLGVGALTG